MDLLRSYESLSSSSTRKEAANILRTIINGGALLLPASDRDRLVVLLLQDIEASLDRSDKKARLSRKDAGHALLALKTLGRAAAASQIISEEANLKILLNATKSLRSSDSDAADDALRCVANALLLIDEGRETWVDIQGAVYCVDLLEKTNTPTLIFLTSRILFLSTTSSSSSLFHYFFSPSLRPSMSLSQRIMEKSTGNHHSQDIVSIISKQLDFVRHEILAGSPLSREATTDLLKFTFNILCHWPKIASDAKDVQVTNVESSGSASGPSLGLEKGPVLGECWTPRLNGFLRPLRRLFLALPPGSPSPLAPPMMHVLHSLLPIPVDEKLYRDWFPESEGSRSGRSSPRSANSSPTSEAQPRVSISPDSAKNGKDRDSDKEKDKEKGKEKESGGGAFDRALHMLTPRLSLSLSSRSPSPVSPSPSSASASKLRDFSIPAPSSASASARRDSSPTGSTTTVAGSTPTSSPPYPPSSSAPTPKIIQRCMDLLDVSMVHYLPGHVDPDDASVKKTCKDEDVELDHVLAPLVLLMTKLCRHDVDCRKAVREHLIPADLDRTSPLEGRADTLGRCIRLMVCVNRQQLKDVAGEFLFVICDSDATIMSAQIGYGNAAGYLFNRGILFTPPPALATKSGASDVVNPNVNPITGMIQQEVPSGPEMTDEEKEREAEKLFVLFERLEKAGCMENPIKKELREGRLEKYAESARKKEEEGDDD